MTWNKIPAREERTKCRSNKAGFGNSAIIKRK